VMMMMRRRRRGSTLTSSIRAASFESKASRAGCVEWDKRESGQPQVSGMRKRSERLNMCTLAHGRMGGG
jgi:hypothetical protein